MLRWEKKAYLFHIFTCIVLDFAGRAPGTTMYHSIQCSLVEGNVDRLVGYIHIAYVHVFPFYPFHLAVAFRHKFNDDRGEIDA